MGVFSGGRRVTTELRGQGRARSAKHLQRHVPTRSVRWGRATMALLLAAGAVVVVPTLTDSPSAAAVSPGVTERVSVHPDGSQADGAARSPSISADGSSVVFSSDAPMVLPDENETRGVEFADNNDIYLRDRRDPGATRLISGGIPQATLVCDPLTLHFDAGDPDELVTCTVAGGSLSILGTTITPAPGPFTIGTNTCVGILADGATCQVSVGFANPATGQLYGGTLMVRAAGGATGTVSLTGDGPPPGNLECTPSTLPPAAPDNTEVVVLLNDDPDNQGTGTITCRAVGGEVDLGSFIVASNSTATADWLGGGDTCPDVLASDATCTVDVVFRATTETPEPVTGVMRAYDDANNELDFVNLSGRRLGIILTLRDGSMPFDPSSIESLGRRDLSGRLGRPVVSGSTLAPGQPVPPAPPLVAQEANGASSSPVISADGRWVAFESSATNLVVDQGLVDPGGTDLDVFLHDRDVDEDGVFDEDFQTSTILITPGPNGTGRGPSISGDGQRIAFSEVPGSSSRVLLYQQGTDLDPPSTVPLDISGEYDLDSGSEPELESVYMSGQPSISVDGLHVAYELTYVGQGESGLFDALVVRDLPVERLVDGTEGTVQRIDLDADGTTLFGLSATSDPAISGNGRYVAFTAEGFRGTEQQVIVVDRDLDGDGAFAFDATRWSEWFIQASALDGALLDEPSFAPAITSDGRYVAFTTTAALSGDPQSQCIDVGPCRTIVMRDLGAEPGAALELISAADPSAGPCNGDETLAPCANDHSDNAALSGDGRYVAFDSMADNLLPYDPTTGTGDTNDLGDVFVRELTPDFVCSPDPADLGVAQVDEPSASSTITCTSTTFGPLRLTGTSFVGGDAARFSVVTDGCSTTVLHLGDSCFLSVRHVPSSPGALLTTLEVTSDGAPGRAAEVDTVQLRGSGTPKPVPDPVISIAPTSIDFGTKLLLSSTARSLTVTNTGTGASLVIPSLSLAAVGPEDVTTDYTITADTCSGASLPSGASCTVTITFRPLPRFLEGAPRDALLVINDSAPGAPHLVPITGRSQVPTVIVNPGVGRGGSVAFVLGTGFPALQPAVVAFDGFAESVLTTSDAEGTVESPLLVMPRSEIGSRLVTVTVAGVTAGYLFLVEPGSVQVGSNDFLIRR